MEVVIPTEIGMPTAKTVMRGQRDDNEELIRQLDWADKIRGNATIRMASYRQRAIVHYNKKAWPRVFRIRTLVLRRVLKNTTEVGARNLQANWEGSYVVIEVGDSGVYHPQTLDDVPLLHL